MDQKNDLPEDIYAMKLGDILKPSDKPDREIHRVPGGWIYVFYNQNGAGGYNLTSCFVPFNNEFRREL